MKWYEQVAQFVIRVGMAFIGVVMAVLAFCLFMASVVWAWNGIVDIVTVALPERQPGRFVIDMVIVLLIVSVWITLGMEANERRNK